MEWVIIVHSTQLMLGPQQPLELFLRLYHLSNKGLHDLASILPFWDHPSSVSLGFHCSLLDREAIDVVGWVFFLFHVITMCSSRERTLGFGLLILLGLFLQFHFPHFVCPFLAPSCLCLCLILSRRLKIQGRSIFYVWQVLHGELTLLTVFRDTFPLCCIFIFFVGDRRTSITYCTANLLIGWVCLVYVWIEI